LILNLLPLWFCVTCVSMAHGTIWINGMGARASNEGSTFKLGIANIYAQGSIINASFAWINGNKWHTTCFWMFKQCHKLVLYWNSIMFPHKAHHGQLETPVTFLQKKPPHHCRFWALLVKSRQRFPGPCSVLCIIPKTT